MWTVASVFGAAVDDQAVATRRLELLQRLVAEQAAQKGFERSLTRARKSVLETFQKQDPDCPMWPDEDAVPDSKCTREAKKLTDRVIGETIAPLNVTELESEAAKAYPVYESGEVVEVPFRSNPVRVVTARGPFRGKTPEALIVGPHRVPIKDVAFRDREAELLKFDPKKSQALRVAYVETKKKEYQEARQAAWDRAYQIALLGERKLAAILNGRNGYILYNGTWDRAQNVVSRMLEDERDRIEAEKRKRELAKREQMRKEEEARQKALEEETAKAEAEKAKAAAEKAAAEAAAEEAKEKRDADAETAAEATEAVEGTPKEKSPDDLTSATEDGGDAAAKAEGDASAEPDDESGAGEAGKPTDSTEEGEVPAPDGQGLGDAQGMVSAPADDTEQAQREKGDDKGLLGLPPAALYGGVAAVALVAAGLVLLMWLKQRPRGRFHALRVDAEREFWGPAGTNPLCRYVAYWYAEEGDARSALAHLSFIEDRGFSKPMLCTPDLDFGVYREVENERERYIAFVGGPALTHMLWREANVRLGRHEEASEHKVSDPPERRAVVPDPATVGGKAASVELMREGEGEGDDFAYYYRFKAPNKESAQAYLKKVAVAEPGLFVVVETPEGHWGKDLRGIYRE